MEFKVDVQYNEHKLGVEGTVTPNLPAVPPTPSDPGSPAEGGEIDITDIYVHGKRSSRRLARRAVVRLADDERFMERLNQAIDAMEN
jgi:hypothetical protein